jgi:hypothetical protein
MPPSLVSFTPWACVGISRKDRLSRRAAHQRVDVIGQVGAGSPAFGAVDDDLVAFFLGARLDVGQIAADVRFGQSVGEQNLPLQQAGQEALLLLFRSRFGYVQSAVGGIHAIDARQGDAAARQFLDDHRQRHDLPAQAAVLLGNRQAAYPQLGEFLDHDAGDMVFLIPLAHRFGSAFLRHESAQRVAQRGDLFAFGEIHFRS